MLLSHVIFLCHGEPLSQALSLLKAKLLCLAGQLGGEKKIKISIPVKTEDDTTILDFNKDIKFNENLYSTSAILDKNISFDEGGTWLMTLPVVLPTSKNTTQIKNLHTLTQITQLSFNNLDSLNKIDISNMQKLESITINNCKNLTSINTAGCTNLQKISIHNCPVINEINRLGNLKNLTSICISKTFINPKAPANVETSQIFKDILAKENLTELDLSYNNFLIGTIDLSKLTNLKTLNLSCCPILACNVDSISQMTKLTTLKLFGNPNFMGTINFATLKKEEFFEEIDIVNTSFNVTNISGVKTKNFMFSRSLIANQYELKNFEIQYKVQQEIKEQEIKEQEKINSILSYLLSLNGQKAATSPLENIILYHVNGLNQNTLNLQNECGYFALYYAFLCLEALEEKPSLSYSENWLKQDSLKTKLESWRRAQDDYLRESDLQLIGLQQLQSKKPFSAYIGKNQFACVPAAYLFEENLFANFFDIDNLKLFLKIENSFNTKKSHCAAYILATTGHYYCMVCIKDGKGKNIQAFIVDGLNNKGHLFDTPINKMILQGVSPSYNLISAYLERQFSFLKKGFKTTDGSLRENIINYIKTFKPTIILSTKTVTAALKTIDSLALDEEVISEKYKKESQEGLTNQKTYIKNFLEEQNFYHESRLIDKTAVRDVKVLSQNQKLGDTYGQSLYGCGFQSVKNIIFLTALLNATTFNEKKAFAKKLEDAQTFIELFEKNGDKSWYHVWMTARQNENDNTLDKKHFDHPPARVKDIENLKNQIANGQAASPDDVNAKNVMQNAIVLGDIDEIKGGNEKIKEIKNELKKESSIVPILLYYKNKWGYALEKYGRHWISVVIQKRPTDFGTLEIFFADSWRSAGCYSKDQGPTPNNPDLTAAQKNWEVMETLLDVLKK